ncbi:glycosyltransferase family 4 protein [bacterium]|nr:glycosyltransferase family 4 protein [bacterium]
MRVGIDARTLLISHKRGIGRYIESLLNHMIKINTSVDFILFGEKENLNHPTIATRLLFNKGYRFHLWEKVFFPFDTWKQGCDILHCPANTCPPYALCPIVVTIHDLNLLKDPARKDLEHALYFKKQLSSAVNVAHTIITGTECAKQDLLEKFPKLPKNKIHVIHHGLDIQKFYLMKKNNIKKILPQFDCGKKYILMIGAQDIFKGTKLGFEAYAKIALESDYDLIITSLPLELRQQYQKKINAYKLTGRVHLLDFITDDELAALYNLADIFLFPSKFEGFGLPLLEAMCCNCRIVANDIPTTREIAGKFAILFSNDVDSFAQSILEAIKGLSCYDFCEQKKHSLSFLWSDSARKTLEIYERIIL